MEIFWDRVKSRVLVAVGCLVFTFAPELWSPKVGRRRCRSCWGCWCRWSLFPILLLANKWDPAIPTSKACPIPCSCCRFNKVFWQAKFIVEPELLVLHLQFWWLGKIGPFPPECANVRRKIWNNEIKGSCSVVLEKYFIVSCTAIVFIPTWTSSWFGNCYFVVGHSLFFEPR